MLLWTASLQIKYKSNISCTFLTVFTFDESFTIPPTIKNFTFRTS